MIKPKISDYKYDQLLLSHVESAALFSPIALGMSKYNIGIAQNMIIPYGFARITKVLELDKEVKPWRYGAFPRKLKKSYKAVHKAFIKEMNNAR